MKLDARTIVGIALLLFAWKGNTVEMKWPLDGITKPVVSTTLSDDQKKWVQPMRGKVAGMLPADRLYLSDFYDALRFIYARDMDRDDAVLTSTEAFAKFHGDSLAAAIDKGNVGKYPGLDEAIDSVFLAAIGTDDPRALTKAEKDRIVLACEALSNVLGIGTDG